jgi:signal transduction histidine kinase
MRRPGLSRPWRWRLRRSAAEAAGTSAQLRGATDEDVRLLRRTRLRLMAVSGVVTLLILVLLGTVTYVVVADRFQNAGIDQLNTIAATGHISAGSDDYSYSLTGARAGVLPILVDPTGKVVENPARTMAALPSGLPNQQGLAAVKTASDTDIRNITLPDGTPERIMTYFSAAAPNYRVQLVQNRTGEVGLLNILSTVLLLGGLLALLASLVAGYLYAGRALVPIRQSIDRRQVALQRQRDFAANASHELRTPLTVIGASVEDLKRNRRSKVEDVGEALGDIEAEVRHMTALVADMLMLARTDSGVVQVEKVPVDLGDVAAEAASMLVQLGQERGVSVMLDPLPAPVTGDPLRLRQLVTILVDNAISHSPANSTVAVWVRPEAGGALLQVDDQGPGVKEEDLPRLFERFWRADDAPAGGTGLGLAIAKWIVEQHGGTIGAFNRPEGGASFWVRVPKAAAAGAISPAENQAFGEASAIADLSAIGSIEESGPSEEPGDSGLLWTPPAPPSRDLLATAGQEPPASPPGSLRTFARRATALLRR